MEEDGDEKKEECCRMNARDSGRHGEVYVTGRVMSRERVPVQKRNREGKQHCVH